LSLRLGPKILPANTPDLQRSSNSQSPIAVSIPKSAYKYEDLIRSLFFLFNLLLLLLELGDFFVRMVVLLHTHFLFFDSCFCYLLVVKLCGFYIMWCKEKGFPLFLFMDLVLLHFRSKCVCVCVCVCFLLLLLLFFIYL